MPARPQEVLATARRLATVTEPDAEGARPAASPLSASRPRLRAVVLLAIALGSGSAMRADQPAETLPGFKPNNLFEARGVDNINIFSGDLAIPIALGPEYPLAPGFSWQLKAYYSAKYWKLDNSCNDPQDPDNDINLRRHAYVSGYPTLGAGWTLELGYVKVDDYTSELFYQSPDGGRHELGPSGRTEDGSNLRITSIAGGYQVEFPDGIVQTFTHQYRPATNSPNSFDFLDSEWPYLPNTTPGTGSLRWGLTRITNRYSQTPLLTVQYAANDPSSSAFQVDYIDLFPVGGSSRRVDYTWTTNTVAGVTWPVLASVSLPSANGATLLATFGFLAHSGFQRNSYDNTSASPVCSNPGTAQVPLLTSIQFSGTGVSYAFAYTAGKLTRFTLPGGGFIDYGYDVTAQRGQCVMASCPDLETTDVPPAQPSSTRSQPSAELGTSCLPSGTRARPSSREVKADREYRAL